MPGFRRDFCASTVINDNVVTHGSHLTYDTIDGVEHENVSVIFDDSSKKWRGDASLGFRLSSDSL
jgi:V8-like Glu-specific endopeptidase